MCPRGIALRQHFFSHYGRQLGTLAGLMAMVIVLWAWSGPPVRAGKRVADYSWTSPSFYRHAGDDECRARCGFNVHRGQTDIRFLGEFSLACHWRSAPYPDSSF